MKNEILEKVLNAHKNLIVTGDIASGKTTNILFPIVDNAINNKECLFILDSREEYINKYYDKLKENNYNIVILNLRDMDKSEGWNPLEYPYNLYKNGDVDKAQEYLEKIGKIIFYENSSVDPFWSSTASDFFTGVTLALFEDGKQEEVNFNSVNNMFNGIDKKYGLSDYITTYFKSKDVTSKPYIFASTTFLAPKETKGSILSVARQKLRLYVSREKLSYLMNKTTFNFEDIVSKPTAIILIARDENKSLNTLSAMFIEQLYAILLDIKAKVKFNFVLDNFDIIEKCNDLVDILDSCLSRNIKVYLTTRSLEKLSDEYGSYMLKLCDLVSIRNDDIKLVINNTEESTEKEFKNVVINDEQIDYPTLNTLKINLFDIEQVVRDLNSNEVLSKFNNLDSDSSFKIDDLIKKIDDKIAEIEIEEKKAELKKTNDEMKSELEQFKINNTSDK